VSAPRFVRWADVVVATERLRNTGFLGWGMDHESAGIRCDAALARLKAQENARAGAGGEVSMGEDAPRWACL